MDLRVCVSLVGWVRLGGLGITYGEYSGVKVELHKFLSSAESRTGLLYAAAI